MMVVEVELEILGLLIDKILSIPLAVSTLSYRTLHANQHTIQTQI